MPTFIRNRLFRPFASTKEGGFGIGAYEVRELVHERWVAGSMSRASPGEGTPLRDCAARVVDLPRGGATGRAAGIRRDRGLMPDTLPRRRLLVIEDDAGLARQLRWAYEDYDVIVAADRACRDRCACVPAEPDVVTLDLGLPPDPDGVTEGFATLAEILGAQARHQGNRGIGSCRAGERIAGDR